MKVRRTTIVGLLTGLSLMPCLASSVSAAEAGENYDRYCKSCHGSDGTGKGPASALLKTPAGNFADCDAMKALKREFLVKIIAEGGTAVGKSPQMPGLGKKLSLEEIEGLADYVTKHFCSDH
jgi:mono/diheme cytochrome c family protein